MAKQKGFERVLPLNPELEKAVLFAMMQGDLQPKSVTPDELSKLGRLVQKSIVALSKGQPIKPNAVVATAVELYHADKTECREFVGSLPECSMPDVQGILQILQRKRIISSIVSEAADQVASGDYSLIQLKSLLESQQQVKNTLVPLLDEMDGDDGPPEGIPIPCLPRLTQTVGGLYGMWLIQGEPAAGKSTLALQVAMSVGRRRPVLYYDFEQGKKVIKWHVREALEGNEEKIKEATHQLYVRNNITSLEYDLAMIGKPCLVVVDSIQKVSSAIQYRTQSLGAWVHKLEALKKQDHHVILVSEKRRGTYGEAALDGGKETGELEYAADTAFDLLLPDEQDGSRVAVHITKNRHYKKKGFLCDYIRKNSWWFVEDGPRASVD